MKSFFKSRDLWLVSSMCLVMSYLWYRLWDLLCYRSKPKASIPSDLQTVQFLIDKIFKRKMFFPTREEIHHPLMFPFL